jgi:hypothetical protein
MVASTASRAAGDPQDLNRLVVAQQVDDAQALGDRGGTGIRQRHPCPIPSPTPAEVALK